MKKKQLVSKVCYLAYEISEFGTEALEGTFYKEFTFQGKKQGFWIEEFARENYVNGKKVTLSGVTVFNGINNYVPQDVLTFIK